METLQLVHSTFGRFVSECDYHGQIGNPSRLQVYVITRIPGTTYIEARMQFNSLANMSEEMKQWQMKLVADFAEYESYPRLQTSIISLNMD